MKLRLTVAAVALAAAGCATNFSYIDGNRYFRTGLNTHSVIVLDIDGKSHIRNPVMVEPGVRVVRVQGPAAPGFRFGQDRTITIDVKPCTRYYLKAVTPNAISPEFTPMVDYEEPISGCRANGNGTEVSTVELRVDEGRSMAVLAAMAGLLPGLAAAGPYDQPYGLIESGDRSQTRNQERVAISKIDGKSPRDPRRPDPWRRASTSVEISFTSARTVVGDDLKTIEIDVEPCKRYRVVAQYHTSVSGKWDPVVGVEDIGECKRKFMQVKPAAK